MPELEVIPDRYDGSETAKLIDTANVRSGGQEPYIEAPLGDDDEFAVFFKVAQDSVDEQIIEVARSLLLHVREIDNRVQESCAAECRASGLHPRNFEGALAYVKVARSYALLHYFGTGVNTEWDELVELTDGNWVHLGVATKDVLARLSQP